MLETTLLRLGDGGSLKERPIWFLWHHPHLPVCCISGGFTDIENKAGMGRLIAQNVASKNLQSSDGFGQNGSPARKPTTIGKNAEASSASQIASLRNTSPHAFLQSTDAVSKKNRFGRDKMPALLKNKQIRAKPPPKYHVDFP